MNAPADRIDDRVRAAEIDANRGAGLGADALQTLDEANRALNEERMPDAAQSIARLAEMAPGHPEVLRLRAVLAHAERRFADASRLLRRALHQRPHDAIAWNNLGSAHGEAGDRAGSIAAFRRSAELAPENASTWINLGRALDLDARAGEAHDALTRALEIDPSHAAARLARARAAQAIGRVEDAQSDYRLAIDAAPAHAWFGLSTLRNRSFDAGDAHAMQRLHADASLAPEERIRIGFALAKALDDQSRHAEAFAVLAEANAAQRRLVRWDAAASSRSAEAVAALFDAPAPDARDRDLGAEVIFVTGMPRSGSTLVEQILAAHPDVEGAGELNALPDVLTEESRRRNMPFPDWVGAASADDWQRLGRAYLERTRRWRTRPRFTDKNLANWRFVGAARAMLPGARFVFTRRDPLETCFSCFRQHFANTQPFSYDLDELASYWRDHDRLLQLWSRRYADRVHVVVHETLLAEPEAAIRALLAATGLTFDEACLRFHEADRDVRTISATQVREPMQTDTARADRYGTLLDPLRRALAAAPVPPASEAR
jgi:tetratricopeptide (TPR) repeat protein